MNFQMDGIWLIGRCVDGAFGQFERAVDSRAQSYQIRHWDGAVRYITKIEILNSECLKFDSPDVIKYPEAGTTLSFNILLLQA